MKTNQLQVFSRITHLHRCRRLPQRGNLPHLRLTEVLGRFKQHGCHRQRDIHPAKHGRTFLRGELHARDSLVGKAGLLECFCDVKTLSNKAAGKVQFDAQTW